MKIHSVKYYDNSREWGYDTIHFSDLTLLVGISGVGKTQILSSLMNLKDIVTRNTFADVGGVCWEISFSNDDFDYFWTGEFELFDGGLDLKFKEETIKLNNRTIARNINGEIFFEDRKMPKLSQRQSLLNIFREEENIKKAFEGFKKIRLRDHTEKETIITSLYAPPDRKEPKTLKGIRESDLHIFNKLYYTFEHQKDTFNVIERNFINIFPQVIDINVTREVIDSFDYEYMSALSHDDISIYIKEKGVNKWISHKWMSSGMLRTFLHLSEMYLLKKGSVVLIDEFETSLGTNCINALAEDLMFENNDIQFIITSHHPYIINQIPYEYWKIVTRENGKIVTYNADEFNLGESHHERFMNLINLPKYKKGIVHA